MHSAALSKSVKKPLLFFKIKGLFTLIAVTGSARLYVIFFTLALLPLACSTTTMADKTSQSDQPHSTTETRTPEATTPQHTDDLRIQVLPVPAGSLVGLEEQRSVPHVSVSDQWFHWCPSIIKGHDGRYHMFHSRWPRSIGFLSWLTHSQVVHAVSDTPEGPFEFVDVAIADIAENRGDWFTAHNPKIKRFNDTYYIYFIQTRGESFAEDRDEKRLDMARTGYSHPLWRNEARPNQRTFVARSVSGTINGPWQVVPDPIVEPAKTITTLTVNPAVAQHPDGHFVMILKGDRPGVDTFDRNQALATAPTPEGPWTILDRPVIDNIDTEDASMWYDHVRERFHAVFHAHSFIGMVTSTDGIEWQKATQYELMRKGIPFDDGTVWMPDRMERPFVLTDELGQPQYLYLANRKGNMTAIVALPLSIN